MTLNPEAIAAVERKISTRQEEKNPPTSKLKFLVSVLLSYIFFIATALFVYFAVELKALKRKTKTIERMFMNIDQARSSFRPFLGKLSIPIQLQTTPLAETNGLMLGSKRIPVRGLDAPYNPSMIEQGSGYLLFFRYDVIKRDCPYDFYTYIGCCELDENFEQTKEEFKTIDTGSHFSEDARAIRIGEEIYLVFNDLEKGNAPRYRSMHIGKLNLEKAKLEYSTSLDLQIKSVEKNWVPFERIENGKPEIYFEYYLNPQKIMKLPNPKENNLVHLYDAGNWVSSKVFWPELWGNARGGSVARLVDGQYLSFFHSFFEGSRDHPWYVMGAYTFEKDPPFRITGISHYPILFEGIYDSPHMNTAERRKRVIFPGSFSEGIREGKEVLYVCCGENDSSIKLIILDKQVLLKNLKKIS
ncbi:MAG TPA: hypothetical protein VHL30_04515 [Chlamydiales bacterium]|jgi:hypothetical protein|nr:hypothetical protein [Chlamydiales bacterium]